MHQAFSLAPLGASSHRSSLVPPPSHRPPHPHLIRISPPSHSKFARGSCSNPAHSPLIKNLAACIIYARRPPPLIPLFTRHSPSHHSSPRASAHLSRAHL
ncbi:hypothetical protein K523DRAFT_325355 [Schizophyllum commune Tattone D]|nr:hypothetical protein K523DRAFT_325355 [Schizophyllum commune Tattone D]